MYLPCIHPGSEKQRFPLLVSRLAVLAKVASDSHTQTIHAKAHAHVFETLYWKYLSDIPDMHPLLYTSGLGTVQFVALARQEIFCDLPKIRIEVFPLFPVNGNGTAFRSRAIDLEDDSGDVCIDYEGSNLQSAIHKALAIEVPDKIVDDFFESYFNHHGIDA